MSPFPPKRQLLLFLVATPLMWGQPKVADSMQKSFPEVPVLAQTATERKAEGDRLLLEGTQFLQIGQLQAALDNLQQALVIYRESGVREAFPQGSRAREGSTLGNLGAVYLNLGQYPQALEFFQQALAIVREVGVREAFPQESRAGEGRTLNNLGEVYRHLGEYPQALEFYQQALAISQEMGDRFGEGMTINNLGLVYESLGEYPQALEFYQQALAISQEMGDRFGESMTINNLGSVYESLGQYPQAQEFYQQALAIAREMGDRFRESRTLNNLGAVYFKLGQYPQTLEFYQQALAIQREIGDRSGEGVTLNNLGLVYESLGESHQALEFYQQALAIRREIGDRSGEGTTLNNLGKVYTTLGESPQALEFYQQALAIRREIGDRSGEAPTLNNLGSVYGSLGQSTQALKYYQQALAIVREVGNLYGEGVTLNNLGAIYGSLGQYAEAEQHLFDAIVVWESLRASELSDDDKISLFDTHAHTYRFLQLALIAQNKVETALEISERSRARAFVELMARRQHSDSDAEFVPLPPPTLADIQQVARDQNATLVEYSIVEDNLLYIWVVRPTGDIDFRQVEIDATTPGLSLEYWVDETFFALGVRGRSIGVVPHQTPQTDPRGLSNHGLPELHQILIDPIADLLPQTPEERVVFIPHGELFQVPFPALKDANGTELIDKHTILTAPAIQVLQLTRQGRRGDRETGGRGEVLVVGNPVMPSVVNPGGSPVRLRPLPHAEREAQTIAQMLGTEPLIGSAATETAVTERMPTARIIHLATHGILDDEGGMSSSIALTPTIGGNHGGIAPTDSDGFLTAEEILGLNLNADLMVLSACDTGRGKVTGDGVVGLSRSLVTAGVSSLVVSLWQVPDAATAKLMTRFYENLQQGLDKATALRNAMLETRATYPAPADWAAFTLIGAK